MDTLDDEHTVAREVQFLAIIFPFARHEVILRHLHRFTLHQARQMVAQQFIIDSLHIIKVILTIRQLRRVYTIHEIVVGRE